MPITGGSAMDFEIKRQRNNYFRSVNTIINDGPAARPEWADNIHRRRFQVEVHEPQ
jgi:hypothetical protein